MQPALGVMVQRDYPPEHLVEAVRRYERQGYDEAWVVEDLTFTGGMTTAAVALQATERIRVGIGILATVVRNPVFAAMDIAALARLHPGRLVVGLGHGVQSWMQEVGARVESPMTMLDETLQVVGALLAGDEVTFSGRYLKVDGVRLRFPPATVPPIVCGVRGPKSLRLAGQRSDGALLAEPTTPEYAAWARTQLEPGATEAGRGRTSVGVYSWLSIDDDTDVACARLAPTLADNVIDPAVGVHLETLEFAAEMRATLDSADTTPDRAGALKPEWVRRLAVAGSPEQCTEAVRRLADAGADRVVLVPVPSDEERQTSRFAADVLPALRS